MKKVLRSLFLPILGVAAVCCTCAIVYFSGLTYIAVTKENDIKFGVCAIVGIICIVVSVVIFDLNGSENNGSSSASCKGAEENSES